MKELYLQKCSDFACEPLVPVLQMLDAGLALEVIDLSGKRKELFNKRVQPMQVFALCEALYEYDKLRVLRLPYNFLNDMAVKALARLIQVNRGLQLLDLGGNEVTAEGAAGLAEVLARPDASLQGLILRSNPLGDKGGLAVADMLRTNTSLLMLDLGDTRLGMKGVMGIANAMTDTGEGPANATLQILDLEDAQLQAPADCTAACQALARMLSATPSLTELSLAKCRLADSHLELLVTYGWGRGGAAAGALTALSLRGNRLSAFSGPTLERLLSLCPRLHRLNLAANQLANDGCVALARCLPYCPQLQALDVRGNGVGDVGLSALAGVLPLVPSLQELTVWGNDFGPGGARALSEALSSPALQGLRCDARPYTVDGQVQVALQDV